MRNIIPKIFALFILLPAFLTIGVSEGVGLSWCFGDDGHVELELTATSGCSNNSSGQGAESHCDGSSGLAPADEHCGPCLDFALEQGEAIFSKRLDQPAALTISILALKSQHPSLATSVKIVATSLAPQPPPRIAQTIIAHRTVVLLT